MRLREGEEEGEVLRQVEEEVGVEDHHLEGEEEVGLELVVEVQHPLEEEEVDHVHERVEEEVELHDYEKEEEVASLF
jgi:hypothetical protein